MIISLVATVPTAHALAPRQLMVGTQPQLFVDDAMISEMSGAELLLHTPDSAEIALQFDMPWEGNLSSFPTVMYDEGLYRMYYNGSSVGHEVTCYAESKDGIHWEKPQLGLFSFQGSSKNNIIWMNTDQTLGIKRFLRYPSFSSDRPVNREYLVRRNREKELVPINFAPFRDTNPLAPKSALYKALGGSPPMALGSPDGIHWHFLSDKRIMDGEDYDSLNTALYDPRIKMYVAYVRSNKYPGREKIRSIVRRTSPDFMHWGSGTVIDDGGAPLEQLYTNGITSYFRSPDVFIGLPMRFAADRKVIAEHPYDGLSDAVFMSSRDGIHFDRRFLEAFIRPGLDPKNWTDRSIIPARGIVPTGSGEISIYYTEHYKHPTNRLRRATLRTDGFVSVHAPYRGGTVMTRPLIFTGSKLVINASTSAVGSIRVEVVDVSGKVPRENAVLKSKPFYGDAIDNTISWTDSGVDLHAMAGRPVQLRFFLRDADLYSFHFEP